jgi:hypothetical protein
MVICPKQVSEVLSVHPDYGKVKARIIDLTPPEYMDSTLVVSGIPVRVLGLEHSHYMEEDPNTGTTRKNTKAMHSMKNPSILLFLNVCL